MAREDYTDSDHHEDVKTLHGMGYAQELSRSMSRFSNFAISFSIICILSGGINSFAQAIGSIGGAGAGIGWIFGCMVSGVFALAMAQIASAFPTAGGLYHWGSILGNRFTGWLTAWLNLLGLVTVLGAINIGTVSFLGGTFGTALGIADKTGAVSAGMTTVLVLVITVIQALFNALGIKITTKLTDLSGYLILGTAALLIVLCLALAPHLDVTRLWTFTNYSGDAGGGVFPESKSMSYLFLLCLLLPVYTITGYDASAHTSEETMKAAIHVPKGIISSVVWSSLVGWVMVSAIMLAIPNMADGAKQGWGVFFWTMDAIMPASVKLILYVLILIAQFLCGLATVTSASRMLFAFSRDGGMPGISKMLAKVSPTFRTPVAAIVAASLFEVIYVYAAQTVVIAGTSLYTIVVNSTLVFLFLSFSIPLTLGMLAYGGKKWPTPGPWAMSAGVYKLVSLLALLGMGLIFYIAVQPPNDYVFAITVGFLVIAIAIWVLFENRRFKGPPIGEEAIARRKAAIAAAEAAVGEAN